MAAAEKTELSNSDHNRIEILAEEGNHFYETGELENALLKTEKALDLVLSPKRIGMPVLGSTLILQMFFSLVIP